VWPVIANGMRLLFSTKLRQARKMARLALQTQYPECLYKGTSMRALERDRFVVAVFYEDPQIKTRPLRYKIYGISKDAKSAQELECDPGSPYWICGRK
jgi:hypothetical protein